jgi:hypothetical protein
MPARREVTKLWLDRHARHEAKVEAQLERPEEAIKGKTVDNINSSPQEPVARGAHGAGALVDGE